jgi:hypothetical protein
VKSSLAKMLARRVRGCARGEPWHQDADSGGRDSMRGRLSEADNIPAIYPPMKEAAVAALVRMSLPCLIVGGFCFPLATECRRSIRFSSGFY